MHPDCERRLFAPCIDQADWSRLIRGARLADGAIECFGQGRERLAKSMIGCTAITHACGLDDSLAFLRGACLFW